MTEVAAAQTRVQTQQVYPCSRKRNQNSSRFRKATVLKKEERTTEIVKNSCDCPARDRIMFGISGKCLTMSIVDKKRWDWKKKFSNSLK